MRLSPFDPLAFFNFNACAVAHLTAGRFEPAIEWSDRALHDWPRLVPAMRCKLVAQAHLGRLDEARVEMGRLLAIDPGLTIAGYRVLFAPSAVPELVELMVTGLRLAGLPEE
jgi:adenylate cyclase